MPSLPWSILPDKNRFESEYEVLSLLKKEVAEATFRVKAIKSGADCALRVFKLPKM